VQTPVDSHAFGFSSKSGVYRLSRGRRVHRRMIAVRAGP
jgi:hypothetical protein